MFFFGKFRQLLLKDFNEAMSYNWAKSYIVDVDTCPTLFHSGYIEFYSGLKFELKNECVDISNY